MNSFLFIVVPVRMRMLSQAYSTVAALYVTRLVVFLLFFLTVMKCYYHFQRYLSGFYAIEIVWFLTLLN